MRATVCVFCASPLTADTRKQHIIQESIGGTLWTKSATCSACNDFFAETLDVAIAGKYRQCMNALSFAIKADGPAIMVRIKGTEELVRMEPGNFPQPRAKVEFNPTGGVVIRAKDTEQALKLLKTTGKAPGVNPKVSYHTEPASGTAILEGIILHEDELRSARKTVIEYLTHKAPDTLQGFLITREIDYIRGGAIYPELRPSILPIFPEEQLLAVGFTRDPFAHRIWIQCGPKGIDCLVGLFSSVAYRFHIEGYTGPPRFFLYQKNILKTSPPDISIAGNGLTKIPEAVPMGPDILKVESSRLRTLYIEACWYVDRNCRQETVDSYWAELRSGKSQGDSIDVPYSRIFEILKSRIEKVFYEAFRREDSTKESNKLFERLKIEGMFLAEKVDAPSAEIQEAIWKLHLELNELHKKYVGSPDYGYENYGIRPYGPQ